MGLWLKRQPFLFIPSIQEFIQLGVDLLAVFDLRMRDAAAVGNDHFDASQGGQILQRISLRDNHVRGLAGGDGSCAVANARHFGAPGGCGVERESVGNADVFVEIAELAPEVVLRDPGAADIVAEHDGDAVFQRSLRAGDDALKNDVAVLLIDLGCVRERTVK